MKGKKGPRPPNKETKPNGHAKEAMLRCNDCPFTSVYQPEMNEHLEGTRHSGCTVEAVEPELFSDPKPIDRKLRVSLSAEEIAVHEHTVAKIAMQRMEQEEIAALAKERVKALEADERAALAKLRDPHKLADVRCEWRINVEENSKTLYRLDTDEVVETKALSAEDRAAELKRIEGQNQPQAGAVA